VLRFFIAHFEVSFANYWRQDDVLSFSNGDRRCSLVLLRSAVVDLVICNLKETAMDRGAAEVKRNFTSVRIRLSWDALYLNFEKIIPS
jgi:hypothetical protein